MAHYIDKDTVIEEINRQYNQLREHPGTCGSGYILGFRQACWQIIDFCNSLEVKEVDNIPNIRFPQYKSIVEKVFGAGNLESWEYNEAEQLVLLAKEELLKDLEGKKVDSELTLKDISMIRQIMFDYHRQIRNEMSIPNDENYCKEILKRFKAQKGE